MYRLLIIEDDKGIAEAIKEQAELWNLSVHCVGNFREVMSEFAAFDPHIVLPDIGLPFFNGYHWCSEIRKVSKVPIIFISSASDNMNMVMAMNMGDNTLTVNVGRLRKRLDSAGLTDFITTKFGVGYIIES